MSRYDHNPGRREDYHLERIEPVVQERQTRPTEVRQGQARRSTSAREMEAETRFSRDAMNLVEFTEGK